MKMSCLALDLKDPALIEEYKHYGRPDIIWPKVIENVRTHGVVSEDYLLGKRMVMVLQRTNVFSFGQKVALGKASPTP